MLQVSDAQVVYLQLIDNFGKLIRRQQFALAGGIDHLAFNDMQSLSNGIYIVQLVTPTTTVSRKVMKQ